MKHYNIDQNMIDEMRNWFHQYPELSTQEYKTAQHIRELLNQYHIKYEVWGTHTIAFIDNKCDNAIAFRADIDALPIIERSDNAYPSCHKEEMHACGHDGHISIVLGLAIYLATNPGANEDNFVFIFQSAEESMHGGNNLVDSEVLNKYNIKEIYSQHLWPTLEQGKFGLRNGNAMAKTSEYEVEFIGKPAHAAQRDKGKDTTRTLGYCLMKYADMLELEYSDDIIFNVGAVEGGKAPNIVNGYTRVYGSMRSLNNDDFALLEQRVAKINAQASMIDNVQINFNKLGQIYQPVINDETLFHKMKDTLEDMQTEYVIYDRSFMTAEDFSAYNSLADIKSYFLFVGTKTDKYQAPLHTDKFDFSNDVISDTIKLYLNLIKY